MVHRPQDKGQRYREDLLPTTTTRREKGTIFKASPLLSPSQTPHSMGTTGIPKAAGTGTWTEDWEALVRGRHCTWRWVRSYPTGALKYPIDMTGEPPHKA